MTKLDELKAEKAAIETKLSDYIAHWKATDGVFQQLNTEHAYLDLRIQEELERTVGLHVGEKIEIDQVFAIYHEMNYSGMIFTICEHDYEYIDGDSSKPRCKKCGLLNFGYADAEALSDK